MNTVGESVNSVRRAVRASFNPDVRYSASPLLTSKTPQWRSYFVSIGLALGFVALAARAVYVQVLERDFYQRQGAVRYARTIELPATRGRILSSDHKVFAGNVPSLSIWAIPEDAQKITPSKRMQLAKILHLDTAELDAKLQSPRSFIWLRRQVDAEVAAQIEALKLEGIYTRPDTRRVYPAGEAVAHLIGFVNLDGRGIEGFERSMNEPLTGAMGKRRVIKDRLGHVIDDIGESLPPTDGHDVTLTIDQRVQTLAYEAIKEAVQNHHAKSGSIIVMETGSNMLLAVANYPSFTAEQLSGQSAQTLQAMLPLMRNRALVDSFEPGSVMKPLSISLALDQGLVTPTSTFQTAPGYLQIGKARIKDAHAHGLLTVEQIVQKSSNVGTVKITSALSEQALWQHFKDLGFGQRPALDFPGVEGGHLRAAKTWGVVGKATQSYGYGLSVSLVQLATAYGAIANDGLWRSPTLLHERGGGPNAHNAQGTAPVQQSVMSPQTAQQLRKMLHMATSPGGTAPRAQTEGYTVGGKTGTTHKTEHGKYLANRYRSTFVGMAPIDKPRIVVAVTVDEPSNGQHFGGDVAAPVFSAVVGRSLHVLGVVPDKTIKPLYTVRAVEESFDE